MARAPARFAPSTSAWLRGLSCESVTGSFLRFQKRQAIPERMLQKNESHHPGLDDG
jgi:hypothetical protein